MKPNQPDTDIIQTPFQFIRKPFFRSILYVIIIVSSLTLIFACSDPTSPQDSYDISLTSPSFDYQEQIPQKYAYSDCGGDNVSPPLEWEYSSTSIESFVIICVDPDAGDEQWIHWILFNIPGHTRSIPENAVFGDTIKEGLNSWGEANYGGPCPPSGTHRYIFTIYALNTTLALDSGATIEQINDAMETHILNRGRLIGLYSAQ